MTELVKILDGNLEYLNHRIEDNTIYIYVVSINKEAVCPYCGSKSNKIHSRYLREFQDLPISSNKTIIILKSKKFFCLNNDCSKTTFAEQFKFISHKSKKTKRLENKIIDISKNMSSIAASKLLADNIANVSKSTICNILKKM